MENWDCCCIFVGKGKIMSIQVECFDEKKAEQELKKCPKIVRDYVKLLKQSNERWKDLTNKAISKLRQKP